MRARRPWLLVVVLLIPTDSRAHGHKADFYAAASFAKGSTLWGVHETLTLTSPFPDNHDVGILGDLSIHKGADGGNDVTRIAFMGGFRATYPGQPGHVHRIFGQLLAGGVHNHEGAADRTDPAIAAGMGYEFHPNGDQSEPAFAARVQVDYVHVFRGGEGFPRFSGGIVYRVK